MKYYLYEVQNGGCDYTIGCGRRLREIKDATSMQEAIDKVCVIDAGEDPILRTDNDELSPNKATILAVAEQHEIDLDKLRSDRENLQNEIAKAEEDKKEREQYEKLKAKFEKKKKGR